ncbi:MAG: class I SAM-dependent RNA methyltransferase [Deltaproteobacteria bacterium]|nr:class I SAM-dependent RNA methyltransferase [Deltaproteobacteria bacterium]
MEDTVEITSLAFGGKGVGRIDGKVVFVPFTAPGDRVRVRLTLEKKGFSEGVVTDIIEPSPLRTKPVCPVYGSCGGCAWQHMGYAAQVEWKERIFEETLRRIGKVSPSRYDPPAPSPMPYNYRSRVGFKIEGGRWGFFESKSHRVVDIESCPIADPLINGAFGAIKKALAGQNTNIYALDIGVSEKDALAVASFHVTGEARFDWKGALAGTGLKGFEVRLNPLKKGKGKRVFTELDSRLVYEAGGMEFTAGINVFSQVNRSQNRALVDRVVEYAGLDGTETVVDLFSGVGNLSLPLSRRSKKTIGIETSVEAVREARANAGRNSVENAVFMREDAGVWVRNNFKTLEKEGSLVVILDPPRSGEIDAAGALSALRPKRIVYVSCSPPALARDLSLLTGSGYRVFRAGLFDMFPQTYHIESIVGLELNR